jgi:FixJ family two-component response regulator
MEAVRCCPVALLDLARGKSAVLISGYEGKMPGLVYVVDDDTSFQTAIQRRLKVAGYEVETYSSAQLLLDRVPAAERPGCILLDVQMPGLSGLELQSRLSELGSTLPIVFVTGHADTPTTVRAIKAGAEDFLTKPASSEQLIDAIERALARYEALRSQRSKLDSILAHLATLTPRERQVFDLIVRGKINKQIATELGTTERTVKAHRHEVMEKMKVHSLAELVSGAERLGLIDRSANSGG